MRVQPPRCNCRRFAIISRMDASPPTVVVVLAREKEAGDRWSQVVAGPSVVVRGAACPVPLSPAPT